MAKDKKKVAKGDKKNKPFEPKTVQEPARIAQLLKKAHENNSVVELRINNRTQIFYSHFADQPAEAEPEGETENPPKKSDKTPFTYLAAKSHLLLIPVIPVVGNKRAKKGNKAMLRFYDGKKAVELRVRFKKRISNDGTVTLKTEYPKSVKLFQQRRHFRVQVLPEVDLKIINPIEARVIDMSVHGLSICYPAGETMEKGSRVTLKLKIPPTMEVQKQIELNSGLMVERSNIKFIEFSGTVRNFSPINGENKICPPGSQQCGIQFNINSATRSMEIGEVYTYIEREYLRSVAARNPAKKAKKIHALLDSDSGGSIEKLWGMLAKTWS
jgi:hypothetical protein